MRQGLLIMEADMGKIAFFFISFVIGFGVSFFNAPPVHSAGFVEDIDGDGKLSLPEVIYAIQVLVNISANGNTSNNSSPVVLGDIDGDGKLSLPEVIYAIQVLVNISANGSASNNTPIANAGPAQNVTVGDAVFLDGSASFDVDGNVLSYLWTLTSKPVNSAVLFCAPTSVTPTLSKTMAGTYVLTLVVDDRIINSAPTTVTVTVAPADGPVPPRAPVDCEIQELTNTAVTLIPNYIVSPSTFVLVDEPSWAYYDTIGKPDEGAVTVIFDSQNVFGSIVRTTAICPANWDNRGYWRNALLSNFSICIFF